MLLFIRSYVQSRVKRSPVQQGFLSRLADTLKSLAYEIMIEIEDSSQMNT